MWATLNSFPSSAFAFLASLFIGLVTQIILTLISSSNLAIFEIPVSEAVLPVVIIISNSSLSVLVPLIVVLAVGRRVHKSLLYVRHWLVRHDGQLSFGLSKI